MAGARQQGDPQLRGGPPTTLSQPGQRARTAETVREPLTHVPRPPLVRPERRGQAERAGQRRGSGPEASDRVQGTPPQHVVAGQAPCLVERVPTAEDGVADASALTEAAPGLDEGEVAIGEVRQEPLQELGPRDL